MAKPRLTKIQRQQLRAIQDILYSRPKSANRQDVLDWLLYIGLVDNYIKKLEYADIPEDTLKDEIQDIWLEICEIPEEKWIILFNQGGATAIKAYVSGIIYREIHSNSSKIYFKYKRHFNTFKHISDEAWDVYDETGIMMPTNEEYLPKETKLETFKRLLETNQIDKIYEQETRKA